MNQEVTKETHLESMEEEELGRIVDQKWSMDSIHLCKTNWVKVNHTQEDYSNYDYQ